MASVTAYSKLPDSMRLINFNSDTFKVMLLSDYTIGTTEDDAQFVADILAVATEPTDADYTAGGLTLSGVTWSQAGTTWTFDCDDPTWPGTTSITAAFALFFDSTPGSDATNPIIGYWDFGGAVTLTPFALNVNAAGLFTIGS